MKKNYFSLLMSAAILSFLCFACSSSRNLSQITNPKTAEEWAWFLFDTASVHSGLFVIEAGKEDGQKNPVIDYNSRSLFTPASNTKILTLYAALKFLPDRLTGLKYHQKDGVTWFKGTGDPGFLDPRFDSDDVLTFLQKQESLVFVSDWGSDQRWGSGWSWDDYPYYYSTQLSPFPIYGNMIRAWCAEGEWQVHPTGFILNWISDGDYFRVKREENSNIFQLNVARCTSDTLRIPFVWDQDVLTTLLADTIHQKIDWVRKPTADVGRSWSSIPGTSRDTMLRAMMYDSDNMIAEQLLMNISSVLWDTISTARVIDTLMETDFGAWKDKIKWVDGSGLSIYNKFSPRFMTELLHQLYHSMPQQKLLSYFPAGGVRGTISSWYGNGGQPYVFAKTGTLSSVHCLSGYLLADSGKTYIFSFMHNNYLGSSTPFKEKMQKLLNYMKENL